jgi:hypothetical protein
MIGRRAVVGLSLLCALVLCALAAPGAMALKGTTAFICKPEPKAESKTKGFEDEHCTKSVEGTNATWVHTELGAVSQLTVSNLETESKVVFPKFKSTVSGVEVELEAGGAEWCVEKTSVKNKETEKKQMEAAGEGCAKFYNVVVVKPTKCSVKNEEISLEEGTAGKSVVKETEGKSEMFIEFTAGKTERFAEISLEGAECALKGTAIKVTGTAKANKTTEEGKLDGPTVRFTTAETEKTLKVGASAAKFEATTTVRTLPGVGQEEDPLALTTTSS